MTIFYFIIISSILALVVFFSKSKVTHYLYIIFYPALQISLTLYAYFHIDTFDSYYYKFDSIGVLLNGLLSIIIFPVIYHSRYYLQRHMPDVKLRGHFYSLMTILSTALTNIYFTDNLVIVWVCLEITTIAVTFLINHERYSSSLEAAWKYLYLSSFGITIAFLGILFLSIKSQNGPDIYLSFSYLITIAKNLDPLFVKISFILLLSSYSIKLNLFPLYAATIDAKTIAPFPVNAITSTALLNAGFISIFRVYEIISKTTFVDWANKVLIITGIISLFIAGLQFFRVKRFKRMFAFSSMEHMSLIIIALTLGKLGVYAAILHLVLHTLTKTGLFLQFGQIRALFNSGWFKDTGGYMKYNPFSSLVYILGLITITAIPPSGMFVSEFLIFKALLGYKLYFLFIFIVFLLTIIIYNMFNYSIPFLFDKEPSDFVYNKSAVSNFEPVSQLILFVLVFYFAYFPPEILTNILNSIVSNIY